MIQSTFSLFRFETRAALGKQAALDVAATIRALLAKQPRVRMVFAAAPSQDEFLAALRENTSIDFGRIDAFHMDEYVGLAPDAPQGFGNFLRARLFDRVPFGSVAYINGFASDTNAACAEYAQALCAAPIDIVCMGIGENGHIAFNDPHEADLMDPLLVKRVSLDEVCRMQQVHDGCFAKRRAHPRHNAHRSRFDAGQIPFLHGSRRQQVRGGLPHGVRSHRARMSCQRVAPVPPREFVCGSG